MDHAPAGAWLDHIGLFVPDMARAARAMERLGFALTPLTAQRHRSVSGEAVPAGTANRLAVLRSGYIELLTAMGDTLLADQMRRAIARYTGAHLIAFGTDDAEATHARLARERFEPLPLVRLQRSAATARGEGLARFSVVRVPPEKMPEGRMQFCQHHTPELVWQREHQAHANRAERLSDILLCVDDPAEVAARYARFLAIPAQVRDGVQLLELKRGRLHILDPETLERLSGIETPTTPFLAAFAVTSTDLAATRALLAEREAAFRALAPDVIAVALAGIATTILFTALDTSLPWIARAG